MKASLVIALLLASTSAIQLKNDSADADDLVTSEEPEPKSNDESLSDNKKKEDNVRAQEVKLGTLPGAVAPPGFQAEDKNDEQEAKQGEEQPKAGDNKRREYLDGVKTNELREPTVIAKYEDPEDARQEIEKAARDQKVAEQENPKVKNVIKNKAEHKLKHGPKDDSAVPSYYSNYDHDIYYKNGEKKPTVEDSHLSGFHGADEDEIMEKIIKAYSDKAKDAYQQETGQILLSKKSARRVAEVALEACHRLSQADVPEFVEKNFDGAWDYFDQNKEGWIRYEESFTFLRHLFGSTNKFAGAPGSIGDLESGGKMHQLPYPVGSERTRVGHV